MGGRRGRKGAEGGTELSESCSGGVTHMCGARDLWGTGSMGHNPHRIYGAQPGSMGHSTTPMGSMGHGIYGAQHDPQGIYGAQHNPHGIYGAQPGSVGHSMTHM